MVKTEILIVGAGVAGLSTAYFLGKSGQRSVIVLEQEKDLGGHASGRNAGMLRQAVSDPVLARLARDSRRYFETLQNNGWKGLSLQRRGSLLIAKGAQLAELRRIARAMRATGVATRWLSHRETEKKVALLEGGDFSRGLLCASDAMLELKPFLAGFLRSLKHMDIPVLTGMALKDVRAVSGGFEVQAGDRIFFAKKLVNAAGAWAPWVAKKAGAFELPLQAYRRHLFVSRADKRTRDWPFVWDVSHNFYFRPVAEGLLLSPCDKILEKKGDRREKTHPASAALLKRKLRIFSEKMGRLRFKSPRSGLRTMTPDGRFAVGEDPRRKGFYWVAGLGGHGVTTCFAVGKLAAGILLGQKVDNSLKRALSPGRFA